jgi:hypothetical protein
MRIRQAEKSLDLLPPNEIDRYLQATLAKVSIEIVEAMHEKRDAIVNACTRTGGALITRTGILPAGLCGHRSTGRVRRLLHQNVKSATRA